MRASPSHKHQTDSFQSTIKRDEYAIREANTVYQQYDADGRELKKILSIFAIVIVAGIFYAMC